LTNSEALSIEICKDRMDEILKVFDNSYKNFIQSIDIINEELIIMNPKVYINNC